MAIQSQNDFSHWEIVNRSDSDLDFDDDVSIFDVESLDSFSITYSSSSDDDEKDRDHRDDAMRDKSLSCGNDIGPNSHVVVDDDVMRKESKSCGDVINTNNHADDVDEMSGESRLCDDVSNLTYHVGNGSDAKNPVDDGQKKDPSIDDDVMALKWRPCDDVIDPSLRYVYYPYKFQNYDYNDYVSDDEEYDGDEVSDMNDELVPWGVVDRFERQRIRKLGKRSCVRMMKAKRSALLYAKPGCVRGKHGLGMKVY